MGFLIEAIFELLWILIEGFFGIGYAMSCEFFEWLIELGKEHPMVSIPIVILLIISIIRSVINGIKSIQYDLAVKRRKKRLQERRDRGDIT